MNSIKRCRMSVENIKKSAAGENEPVGSTVRFGRYRQSDTDAAEDIEWRVLTGAGDVHVIWRIQRSRAAA